MTKEKVIQFIKNLILMTVIFSIIEFIFYKLKLINSFNIYFIVGFMTGWSIVQIIKLIADNKKSNVKYN